MNQDQIVAEDFVSTVYEEDFFAAERRLGRMCTKRSGCGWLAKAQATARVDVPTASVFFCSVDRGVHDVYTGFVRMLGHVLVRQPTVILREQAP